MAPDGKCFTFTWRIENYDFSQSIIRSPSFVIDSNKKSSWYFEIDPKSALWKDHITLQAKRKEGDAFGVNMVTFFFTEGNSTPLHEGFFGTKPCSTHSFACYVPHSQVYVMKKGAFLAPQTLTIRCCMYKTDGSFSEAAQCYARTRIRLQRKGFIAYLPNFSRMTPGVRYTLKTQSSSAAESQLFNLELCFGGDSCCSKKFWIEAMCREEDENYVKHCKSVFYLLDSNGRKTECGRHEYSVTDSEEWKVDLYFTKGYLMRRKEQFLSNNTLRMKSEFTYSTGIEFSEIEDSEFASLAVIKNQSKFSSAMEDFTRLYQEGILCDIKLRAETETFNSHKSILGARSSVFRSMFETDMQEKMTDSVVIEDLDAKSVHRMLLYLYSDKLEDMDWESAKRLYFAADKYDIVALKHKCSDFLQSNLHPLNCCELLFLADLHRDDDLKLAVHEYIADHREEVFRSNPWTIFEKSNPKLSIETFHSVFLGDRKI